MQINTESNHQALEDFERSQQGLSEIKIVLQEVPGLASAATAHLQEILGDALTSYEAYLHQLILPTLPHLYHLRSRVRGALAQPSDPVSAAPAEVMSRSDQALTEVFSHFPHALLAA